MARLSEKVQGVLAEVTKAAAVLEGELPPHERVAVARAAHQALGDSLDVMERHAKAQKWAGRKVREMTRAEKVQMVADIGHKEFERRLASEY